MKENKSLLWGFLKRRECVLPTWRGWLLLLVFLALVAALAVSNTYNFLAMNAPLPDGILVVEGWGPDYVMDRVLKEYQTQHYDAIFTTGGPVDKGANFTPYKNFADMAAATLEAMGIDPKSVHSIPADGVTKDRTFSFALALKKWLADHGSNAKNITLITLGAHARRSHLLYEKAFGGSAHIGVIAVYDKDIDAPHWWMNSAGFRTVTDEAIAYIYARFLFHSVAEK